MLPFTPAANDRSKDPSNSEHPTPRRLEMRLEMPEGRSASGVGPRAEQNTPPATPITRRGSSGSMAQDYYASPTRPTVMTPPRTPSMGSLRSTASASNTPMSSTRSFIAPQIPRNRNQRFILAMDGSFTLFQNSVPFGSGAWSAVNRAVYQRGNGARPEVIAVKQPVSKEAITVLTHEAQILSHLCRDGPINGVVPFYGFDPKTYSLLFAAHPTTLEHFIKKANYAINDEENFSLSTTRCPVVKMHQWLFFAHKLCQAFAAIKKEGIIHGDIKPGNILLREWNPLNSRPQIDDIPTILLTNDNGPLWEPLVADFSSSRQEEFINKTYYHPEAINALTVSYAAPELLDSFYRYAATAPSSSSSLEYSTGPQTEVVAAPSGIPIPTFSSDLFSLAVTLLVCSIGADPYTTKGATERKKSMWARYGDPLGFARGDERGLRCLEGGVVADVVKGCFGKTSQGRVGLEVMSGKVRGWVSRWDKEGRGNNRWGCS